MYLPINPQKTCATAWLEATTAVKKEHGHESHNVIIDVDEPLSQTHEDAKVITLVDEFLSLYKVMPLQSVANTIFPEELYRRHGAPEFYDKYKQVYKVIKKKKGGWGRYFERMIHREGSDGKEFNPLAELIEKMRQHVHGGGERTFRNIYELVVYDPERDSGPVMNRQCLSFLSFKLDQENRLLLTAIYRNHYYIERLFGNLIGLARLMAFICKETQVGIGALTIVSTHAVVDTPRGCRRGDVDKLLAACAETYRASEVA